MMRSRGARGLGDGRAARGRARGGPVPGSGQRATSRAAGGRRGSSRNGGRPAATPGRRPRTCPRGGTRLRPGRRRPGASGTGSSPPGCWPERHAGAGRAVHPAAARADQSPPLLHGTLCRPPGTSFMLCPLGLSFGQVIPFWYNFLATIKNDLIIKISDVTMAGFLFL